MSEPSANWVARWREGKLVASAMLLLIAIAAGCMVLAPTAWWIGGSRAGMEVGVAALICLFSGFLAIAVTSLQVVRRQPLVGLLFAMAFRVLPPLIVCLVIALRGSGKEYLGFIGYLVLFYLISLAVETYLSVQQVQSVD